MTREQAEAEVQRRRDEDPEATWLATERGRTWRVARVGIAPRKPTHTTTESAEPAPHDDPGTPLTRATYWVGAG